jgi:hypothetical protein
LEYCEAAVDIVQRTWNLLAVFYDFKEETKTALSNIFTDSSEEIVELLKLLGVKSPSVEV